MTLCGNELCSHQQCATMRRDKRRAEWRLNAAGPALLEACRMYLRTYADTQTHPTVMQEALVINAMRSAITQAEDAKLAVCYVNSETDCDGELHTCENCGRTMCFSHSAKVSDYSGEHVTYCAECAGRP